MTAFHDRPASGAPLAPGDSPVSGDPCALPASAKSRRLLALPVLAALLWAVPAVIHQTHLLRQVHRNLQEFRGEAPEDPGPNRAMSSALVVRGQILMHRISKISAGQESMLLGILSGPADDMAQSEALDVLGIAKRMHALSPAQEQESLMGALATLRRSPGPMVRLESARLLGHLRNVRAIPALLALQSDSDPKVQKAAGNALAEIKQ